jgi:hypothetical protein
MNSKVVDLASRLTKVLIDKGVIIGDNAIAYTMTALAGALQAFIFPEKCETCGEPLCQECGSHLDPPLADPKTEFEGYHLCVKCVVYVKPDKMTAPITDYNQDRRFINIIEFFRTRKVPHKPKDWLN